MDPKGELRPYNSPYMAMGDDPINNIDPDGEFFGGTIITFFKDLITTTFFKGGLDLSSKKARQQAWRDFDPSAEWSQTNKAWKIDIGGFKTDESRNFVGRWWQLTSRWTWELPQTMLGKTVSHVRNLTGNVDNVEYYRGTTLVNDNNPRSNYMWGMTLGSFINSQNIRHADPTIPIFRHEFGHTIQSRWWGPLYLLEVGAPSLLSQGLQSLGGTNFHNHDETWFEIQANRMSYRYLDKRDPGALTTTPWAFHEPGYSRSYKDINWWWFLLFNPITPVLPFVF